MQDMNLRALRADYDRQAGRSLALPVAGAIVWTIFAIGGFLLPERPATLLMLFGSGVIFPLGLLIARFLGENIFSNTNPFSKLMGVSVLMVNLLWAMHFSLLVGHPAYLPLSLGISLGLHWIVFGWIIDHPLGIVHAILRTGLVTGLWWLFPAHRIEAVAAGVVIAYLYAIYALATRQPNKVAE